MNSEIHSQAMIEQVERYTWRGLLSVIGDTLEARDSVWLEINFEAVIEGV